MSSIWSSGTGTDITVERARAELTNAHNHAARVEEQIKADAFCCEHHQKYAQREAKKQVNRWSQWLADHDTLERGTQAGLPGL